MMDLNFEPLDFRDVKRGNEATGKHLNVTEANILIVIDKATEKDMGVTLEMITAVTGYTWGQVYHAISALQGMGQID